MNPDGLSLIITTKNDNALLTPFVDQLDKILSSHNFPYEVIIIDNHSTDSSKKVVEVLSQAYPITFIHAGSNKKINDDLIKTLAHCRYNLIGTLTDPSAYHPEIIASMIGKLFETQADVVIAQRNIKKDFAHRLFALSHNSHKVDIQSGLKIFKKEISDRLYPKFKPTSFDLEFLSQARDAGYKLELFHIGEENSPKSSRHSDSFWTLLKSHLKLKAARTEVIPFHPETEKLKGEGFHYKGQEFVHHSKLKPHQSAIHRLSGTQMGVLLILLTAVMLCFIINWHASIVVFVALLTLLYFADLLFNLYLIYRSFSKPAEVEISKAEVEAVTEWPTYTILCPLYKEWRVIPQFVTAMSHMDYPKDKLQVMLLLEEDDKETIKEVANYDLPPYFEVVVVPDSKPKTKPKASNYGLKFARGEYVVIYDAEDVPDVHQLKKAILAFGKTDKRTICIQAKLNFYNPHQNLLTRVFTAEYSLWFDLVLTGLQSIHAPIPLGGTSNHFRRADLIKLKGWDSFNVTEDCDLGMRLVKQGYQTAVINSITLEEANSDLGNWFGQRSRWIKGYMQTYLIHMRDPREFLATWREPHALTFQMVVGGKVLSMFINPLMWVITISYFLFRADIGIFIESFFPAPVLYMGVISLLLGNFLYVYYYMIGCAKHGHHELVKYGIFVPFYWLAMSMAAWMAVYKLITAPHHWSKTKHGLHLNNEKAIAHAHGAIGKDLVDKKLTHISINNLTAARI